MKTCIAVIFFIGFVFSAVAQDKNDLLYEAIIKSDKAGVEKQLAAGASANYVKELSAWLRVSMLIAAVDHNDLEIVKLLLGKNVNLQLLAGAGANVNDNDGKGNSVLSAAKESQEPELIAFIESKIKAGG